MANLLEDNKIIKNEIHSEMKSSYIDYAMSVIVGRALPDVRDGLKPIHRRILYAMSGLGVTPDKSYKKSATIVGEVMGKYHPHGDSSIYDAMVRMAQDFSTRYMLVDGHGNFGSVDGDRAAAMRYTEAKMTNFASQMLRDIEKKTVDFVPNFDDEEEEPTVLPAKYPNLLVNGSNGIAVGMATSIPPHNLREVIDATIKLIDDPETTADELSKIIKGPDFPTGATILGGKDAREAYRTGQGKVVVRAKTEIEETSRGKTQIVITEIPYQVNKARLIEKIAILVKEKKLEGISDIRDESSRKGMRIVIELKRDANPNITINRLYKHTQLQDSYSIIMIALVNGEPKLLTLSYVLKEYIKHQKDVLRRRTQFDLDKALARAHILEGLMIALDSDNIDKIIKTIRESYNDAREKLMKGFNLSEIQAQAILDMRLARLQGLEKEKIENEYNDLKEKITYYNSLLAEEKLLMNVIKDELLEVRSKYGDARRTKIVLDDSDIDEEDLIEERKVAITLTHLGYIKRVDADTYKTQKRGGKGITALKTRDNDFVKDLILTSTHSELLFFTNSGKIFKIKAYEIPEASRTAKGMPAVNFLNLMQNERITAVIPVSKDSDNKYLISVTKKGYIKKTPMEQFQNIRKNGVIAISLEDGDSLIGVKQSSGEDKVIVVTHRGMSLCFGESDVRSMGRQARGVRAIKLKDEDFIVSMELVSDSDELFVVSEKGFGKRTKVSEYRVQARGGVGILTYSKGKFAKTGKIVGAMVVKDEDDLLLINSEGTVIRISASEIARSGRVTIGVKIMRVQENSQIIAMAKVINEDEVSDGKQETLI